MANHYVRAGATGSDDGSNWTNAFTDLPASMVRGDVYYVAGGTYGAHDFADVESGATFTYVLKATKSSHGIEEGWSDSYADTQAHFTRSTAGTTWEFTTGFYYCGGIFGTWGNDDYGIKVSSSYSAGTGKVIEGNSAGVSYLYFDHIDIEGPGLDTGNSNDPVYMVTLTNGLINNINFTYCNIHHGNRTAVLWAGVTNSVIATTALHDCYDSVQHGELISHRVAGVKNNVIRHNKFYNNNGTAIIAFLDQGAAAQSNVWIFGNEFSMRGWVNDTITNGLVAGGSGDRCDNIFFYNNTIYDSGGGQMDPGGLYFDNSVGSTGNLAYNNLWYGATTINFQAGTTHDYNAYDEDLSEANGQLLTADPFVDSGNNDFRLLGATDAGWDLGSSPSFVNYDVLGRLRGGDGNWDRGMFERQIVGSSKRAATRLLLGGREWQ